jgi:hypothetical protein
MCTSSWICFEVVLSWAVHWQAGAWREELIQLLRLPRRDHGPHRSAHHPPRHPRHPGAPGGVVIGDGVGGLRPARLGQTTPATMTTATSQRLTAILYREDEV